MYPSEKQFENGFEAWATDSISSALNDHQTFFHATPANFTSFAAFQHFGSKEAAENRAKARASAEHFTHEVWLAIKTPLLVGDDQAANHVASLAINACAAGLFDEAVRDRMLTAIRNTEHLYQRAENYSAAKWQYTMSAFAKELSSLGYDGLKYNNTVEGGVSYVPFRGNQIWWVQRDNHET